MVASVTVPTWLVHPLVECMLHVESLRLQPLTVTVVVVATPARTTDGEIYSGATADGARVRFSLHAGEGRGRVAGRPTYRGNQMSVVRSASRGVVRLPSRLKTEGHEGVQQTVSMKNAL